MWIFSQPPSYYLVVALGAFMIGFSKAGFGGALGVFITPMVSLVMPADQAVGLLLPVLMLGDIFAMAAHWGRWDIRQLQLLVPGALMGVTLGTFVLTSISPLGLRRSLALLAILFILYRLFEARIQSLFRVQGSKTLGIAAGGLAGFASTLAHAGGPPVTIYLLLQKLSPRVFVATMVLLFTLLNLIKVPYYWAAGMFQWELLLALLWLLPLVPLGVWLGRSLSTRISKSLFEKVILVLLGVSVWFLLQ